MTARKAKPQLNMQADLVKTRYGAAIDATAPRVAAATPGVSVRGYWISNAKYFFVREYLDSSLGRIMEMPAVYDAVIGKAKDVIPQQELLDIISTASAKVISRAGLLAATYEMPDEHILAVLVAGREYRVQLKTRNALESRSLLDEPASYSPSGRYACVIRKNDIWIVDRSAGTQKALISGGTPLNRYGQECESNLAILSYRRSPYPLIMWSQDSRWILTHQIDEEHVPELPLVQHVVPDGGRPVLHTYRYPFPNDPVPVGTLVFMEIDTGRTIRLDAFKFPVLAYSPLSEIDRTAWFHNPGTGFFLRFDRYSQTVELIRIDLISGEAKVLLSERAAQGYVELHQSMIGKPNVRILSGQGEIVWFSERDGWGHLYLYRSNGELINQITSGEWLVRDIVHLDEASRRIYFTACGLKPEKDAACRSFCAINLDGTDFEILHEDHADIAVPKTELAGLGHDVPSRPPWAQPGCSSSASYAVVRTASVKAGNTTAVLDLRTKKSAVIARAKAPATRTEPLEFTAMAADGCTRLSGLLFLPSDFDISQRYPIVDFIYPGPHIPHKPQAYGTMRASFAQALAEIGLAVVTLDSRGVPFRRRSIHQVGYGDFLEPQLTDHAAVVRQLAATHKFLDAEYVGIVGYSAGGAATARALLDHGDVFKVGVSVCGNHDNNCNISMWSDKYRGPGPVSRWSQQSNATAAATLKGKLFLISGDLDDNCHISHTMRLVDALVKANKDFDLLIVPNEAHELLMKNGYVHRRVWDYFLKHLRNEEPPAHIEVSFQPHELARLEKIEAHEWNL